MLTSRFVHASPDQRALMTLAVEQCLRADGARCEFVRVAPSEWRAEWHRPNPRREQILLATIFVERETEARAALIAAIWDGLHGAGQSGSAAHLESHQ